MRFLLTFYRINVITTIMYSSFHAAVGGAIMLLSPDPVLGLVGAFVSHFAVDYLGEAYIKRSIPLELSLLAAYVLSSFLFTDIGWWLFAAWIASNLPDLIDKPLDWFFGRKQWFSCHNGKGLFSYGNWKFGYPVAYRFTTTETIALNVCSTAIFIVLLFV